MSDFTATAPTWAVVHGGGGAAFLTLSPGQVLAAPPTRTVETFTDEAAATARMRDFDPVFRFTFDVNAAPAADLDLLPGIGPALAEAIVEGRPYEDVADLERIDGISATMVQDWGEAIFAGPYVPPAPPPPPPLERSEQLAWLADLRWQHETGGLNLPDGRIIKTSRESQAQINSVLTSLSLGMISEPVSYKLDSGWEDLTGAQIMGIAALVAAHVKASFEAERSVSATLDAMDDYWTADHRALFFAAYAEAMEG